MPGLAIGVGLDSAYKPGSAALSAATLGSIFTLGYWHAQYSSLFQDAAGTIPATSLSDPVARFNDLSSAANHLTDGEPANPQPVLAIDAGVKSLDDWDTETASLFFNTPLSLTGAFTFIYLVDGHAGADTHCVWAGADAVNQLAYNSGALVGYINENPFNAAGVIPNSATKVMIAVWRTGDNVVKFAATGLPTVTVGTIAGTFDAATLGGDAAAGFYETRKLIAAGVVNADVSSQLPAIAATLGTTLTL